MGFFEDYFIRPVIEHTGYNIINTITYAIVLIAALFAIYKILLKIKIRLDRRLWLDLIPFVFLGGTIRALQDINFFGFLGMYHALFVTPMIYIIIFSAAFAALLVSRYLWRNFIRYFGISLAIAFVVPVLMNMRNAGSLLIILAMTGLSYAIIYFILRRIKLGIIGSLGSFNSLIVAAHLLDASAAFIAVSVVGGYEESGVFTSFLFSQVPGWVFIPIKAFIVLLALHFIDKEVKNEMNWILKFAVMALGLGPALHDTFSVMMGSSMA